MGKPLLEWVKYFQNDTSVVFLRNKHAYIVIFSLWIIFGKAYSKQDTFCIKFNMRQNYSLSRGYTFSSSIQVQTAIFIFNLIAMVNNKRKFQKIGIIFTSLIKRIKVSLLTNWLSLFVEIIIFSITFSQYWCVCVCKVVILFNKKE